MFQKVYKNRVRLEGTITNSIKMEEFKQLEIKQRKSYEEMRKKSLSQERNDEINQSKDSNQSQKRTTSKSKDKQVSFNEDSLKKDEIKEGNVSHSFRQSNMSYQSSIRETKSSRARTVKDLRNLDYILLKRDQSRERGEYYDMGENKFRNYKYEKLKLQRPELNFLQNKPLDFFGSNIYNRNKIQNFCSTEKAIQSIKHQQDIINLGLTDLNSSVKLKENSIYQEIRQKIQNDKISNQDKEYPFEGKKKITKSLAKLEQHIRDKNNITLSNFPSVYSARNQEFTETQNSQSSAQFENNMLSKTQSMKSVKSAGGDRKWLSPLIKYENIESARYKPFNNTISKTDLILKNELLRETQNSLKSDKQQFNINSIKNKDKQEELYENDGACLSIINFNKAFKGKGKKMHSLLQYEDKIHHKNKPFWELAKSFNKKSQNLLVVEEFSRLLQQDRIDKARSRTKKIKTQMDKKIDETQFETKIATHDHCISEEIFLRETFFFNQYIRNEPNIRERVLYGISNQHNGIDFESYFRFYQIFVFQNTPSDTLIQFICKYFIFNKETKLAATNVESFLEALREIVNHPSLLDREQCYQNWEKNLKELKSITFDPNFLLRIKHLENIFKSDIINPNLILKLLFK